MHRVSRSAKQTLFCRLCKADKGEVAFAIWAWDKFAKRAVCRACEKARAHDRYVKFAVTQSVTRHERKLAVQAIKVASGCVQCGEKHPACLDFHHKDPATKTRGIGVMVRMEDILAEIAKCDVLCANCHRKHHHDHGGGTRRKYDVDVLPFRRQHSA